MKKIIQYPKIKDYYSSSNEFSKVDALIHLEVRNFNLVSGLVLISVAFLALSFLELSLVIIPLTLGIYLAIEYFQLKRFCHKFEVTRFVGNYRFTEGERIKVKYHFNQTIDYKVTLFEDFEGIGKSEQTFRIGRQEGVFVERSFHLDQGFGEFEFRHLKAIVSDSLGFFVFKIDFKQREKIQVYPRIQSININESLSLSDAKNIGEYEFIKRGISPIFYGLREYRYGDAFKFINWKASAKTNKMLVNEYENIQSLEAVIYIDLNPMNHMGTGVNSTWEYCRDIALSLAQVHVDRNHLLQMISHDYITENTQANVTMDDMRHYLHFCQKENKCVPRPISQSLSLMEVGSCLSIVLPLGLNNESTNLIKELKNISDRFSQIDIYFVDAFEAVKETIAPEYKARVMSEQKNAIDLLENERENLVFRGINIHICKVEEPHNINTQLRKVS